MSAYPRPKTCRQCFEAEKKKEEGGARILQSCPSTSSWQKKNMSLTPSRNERKKGTRKKVTAGLAMVCLMKSDPSTDSG